MDRQKVELFENCPIPKAVVKLAVPSVMGTLVMVLYNFADTYFVGQLNDSVQTAAVSLAAPMLLAFNAVNNLFGVGASSMMSRSIGKKDYDSAKRAASFSFWMSAVCAVLISVAYACFSSPFLKLLGTDAVTEDATARYLFWTVILGAVPAILNVVLSNMVRSEGAAMQASLGVMSGCLLNILLDPFFVLPRFLGMGAAGAGCATFLSNCFATGYLLTVIFVRRRTTVVCISPKQFGFRGDIVKEVFGVGFPAAVQNLLNVTGSIILNNFAKAYTEDAVSAIGISHKINLLPLYVSMGVAQGVMPLISYNFASGNRKRMRDTITFVAVFSVISTTVMGVFIFAFSGNMIAWFMEKPEVVSYGSRLLRAMAVGIPFLAVDFLAVGVFQAIGKGIYSLFFAIARKIVLEIPALIILNRMMPLYGLGYAQPVSEIVLSVAAIVMLRRIYHLPDTKIEK